MGEGGVATPTWRWEQQRARPLNSSRMRPMALTLGSDYFVVAM